jgi:hypothetical protein
MLQLAQIHRVDLQKNQIQISILSPPLPAKKFSISKTSLQLISTNNIIGRLTDAPTRTATNKITLTEEQFVSIQDLCDEF